MDTTPQTSPSPAPGHGAGHGHAYVPPNDPDHDIDAKATVLSVSISAVVLFIGLWLLLVLFDRMLADEIQRKIDANPPVELQQIRAAEQAFLAGNVAEGVQGKPIEQVMQELAR